MTTKRRVHERCKKCVHEGGKTKDRKEARY